MSRIYFSFLLLACACSAARAAPFAYVPNEKSASVTVIDTATGAAVRQIAAGQRPRGIAADPAGTRLYVTDAAANALLVLDAASGALLATIPPRQFARGRECIARRPLDRRRGGRHQ